VDVKAGVHIVTTGL